MPPASTTERGTYRYEGEERTFALHRGAGAPGAASRALVVVLHGCTQDAADIARGTRFSEWADRERFTVLYPEQPARAHPQRCWNWYSPAATRPDSGETGLVAALIDSIRRSEGVPPTRVALVGVSAGAAMAASLAIAHPTRYGALALHSGVPAAAASGLVAALALMRNGVADHDALGGATARARGSDARPIPVLAIHGAEDRVAAPANLDAICRQWSAANAAAGGESLQPPAIIDRPPTAPTPGYTLRGTRMSAGVECWRIGGLGHAWSGGAAAGSYTEPHAPDATAMIVAFLHDAWRSHGRARKAGASPR